MGLPAGLGVLIVSPEAFSKAEMLAKIQSLGSYHSFLTLNKYALKNHTPETPNVLTIYLLGKISKDMDRYGLGKIRRETEKKAKMLYEFFEGKREYRLFIKKSELRSQTIVVIEVKEKIQQKLKNLAERGFILGSGYGKFKNKQIRIANFPAHSLLAVEKLLKTLSLI